MNKTLGLGGPLGDWPNEEPCAKPRNSVANNAGPKNDPRKAMTDWAAKASA